jgi:hypothetical protein
MQSAANDLDCVSMHDDGVGGNVLKYRLRQQFAGTYQ